MQYANIQKEVSRLLSATGVNEALDRQIELRICNSRHAGSLIEDQDICRVWWQYYNLSRYSSLFHHFAPEVLTMKLTCDKSKPPLGKCLSIFTYLTKNM